MQLMSLTKEDLADIKKIVVAGAMEAINAVVIPRLDAVEAHLTEHDQRFEEIDKRFDKIEDHLAKHDRRFDEHDRRFDAIDRRLGDIEKRLTTLEGRVEALENDVKELYAALPPGDLSRDRKLTPEQRLRQLYAATQALARELNVEL